MKKTILILWLLSASGVALAQTAWTNKNRVLPDRLRRIPTGITMWHTPDVVYPKANPPGSPDKYFWPHSTTVQSVTATPLEVIAAGSFIWYNDSGWQTNMVYSKAEFSEHFVCKNGVLQPGVKYTFKHNNRYGSRLYGGDALWYVLAKDKKGKLYKGMALVETEDTIENQ
jgi:hypothetical protein